MQFVKSLLVKIISVLFLLMLFVGFYMSLRYMHNTTMLLIFVGMTAIGLGGLIVEALLIMRKSRLNKPTDEKDNQEDKSNSDTQN